MKNALAVLSHVSHGYVGNRAMAFPLQVVGWDVDLINTTNFSNHPGYGKFKGTASKGEELTALFEGLSEIDRLSKYQMIVTGYVPNEELLRILLDQLLCRVFTTKVQVPEWIVDPVLGDNGKLYVLERVVPIYRELLSSGYVSCITPNQFEFETICGAQITDLKSLRETLDAFYQRYRIPNVALLSIELDGKLYSVGFHRTDEQETSSVFLVPIERIPAHFFGCGDLFTALLSVRFHESRKITPQILGNVLHKLTRILRLSLEIATERNGNVPPKAVKDIQVVALQPYLVDSVDIDIDNVVYL